MAGYSDESKYRIDPNITTKIMDSKGVNYGHAISKMFDSLGAIETQKEENAQKQEDRELTRESLQLNIDNAKKDAQIKEISVSEIQKKIADKNNFSTIVTSQNPQETFKGIKFNNPEFYATTQDYLTKSKNALKDEQKEGHFKAALAKFTGEDGVFKIDEAIKHLDTQYKNDSIDEATFYNVTDALREKSQTGIYTPKTTAKDNAAILASQSTVAKNLALAKKYEHEMKNGSGGSSSENERNLNTLLNSGIITLDEYYEKIKERVDKMANPDMTAISKDLSVSEKYKNKFITDLKKQEDFKDIDMDSIVNIDMSKLTPVQKSKAESLANIIVRAEKPSAAPEITKRMLDIGVQQQQLNDTTKLTLKYMKDGKDFNMVDKAVRENFSNYTGLNDKELENSWRDARFQEALNIQLKIQSGTAVSAQEWERFKSSMGTLYQTNKRAALGMLSMATNLKSQVGVLANSMGGEAFHLKYGHIVGNINKMENELQDALFVDNKNQDTQKKVTRIIGKVVKTGIDKSSGRRIQMFEDGSVEYAD